MVRAGVRASEEALEWVVVLEAAAALVEAAELALVVELVQEPEAVLAQAVELGVAVLAQEVGQELELVVEAKHLESGSLHLHCYEVAVLALAAQCPEERAEGREAVALGLAWRKKMSARCWGSSHSLGSLAKIPKRRWTSRRFSRA